MYLAGYSTPSDAQSLQLSRPVAHPGEPFVIELSLKSPAGREPSALQWEKIIPTDSLAPLEENIPGAAAHTAGKNLSCEVKAKSPADYTSVCLLYGGQERIRDGVVAILRLRLSDDARPGSFRVRITEPLAVLPDAKRIPMTPVETVVTIRPR